MCPAVFPLVFPLGQFELTIVPALLSGVPEKFGKRRGARMRRFVRKLAPSVWVVVRYSCFVSFFPFVVPFGDAWVLGARFFQGLCVGCLP